MINPTLTMTVGDVAKIPFFRGSFLTRGREIAERCVDMARIDWDNAEVSWDFRYFPFFEGGHGKGKLASSFAEWEKHSAESLRTLTVLEEENNRLLIDAYGLQNELSPEVPQDQITLARADREADIKRLISYAVGCMMGRYSLNEPGLIYAHAGNAGFDAGRYQTFPADPDGIVPVTDLDWFGDDAANRFVEFLKVTWTPETLTENLKFVADSRSAAI
jgi:hypothetical protein